MEERNSVTIHETNEQVGEVKIADEVVAIIAGLAANEVEGVEQLGGASLPGRKGKKNLAKGIAIDIADNDIVCDINVQLDYGVNILGTAKEIQQKVKTAVENMTGLNVKEVNVHITGIKMNKE